MPKGSMENKLIQTVLKTSENPWNVWVLWVWILWEPHLPLHGIPVKQNSARHGKDRFGTGLGGHVQPPNWASSRPVAAFLHATPQRGFSVRRHHHVRLGEANRVVPPVARWEPVASPARDTLAVT